MSIEGPKASSPEIIVMSPPRMLQEEGPVGDAVREELRREEDVARDGELDAIRARIHRRSLWRRGATTLLAACIPLGLVWLSQFEGGRVLADAQKLVVADPEVIVESEWLTESRRVESLDREGERGPDHAPELRQREVFSPGPASSLEPAPKIVRTTEETTSIPSRGASRPTAVEAGDPEREGPGCSVLTSQGDYEAALACYDEQANGHGVGAELSLLEKARLQRRAFGDDEAALETVTEHVRRFAGGTLQREALLMRLDLLLALDRKNDALRLVDDVLRKRSIPERDAELLLLRARLHGERGHCKAALEDAERASGLGVSPDRIVRATENCQKAE